MAQYTGLYGMDLTPEEEEAGFLDISQAAGTPTYKIPEFDRYSYAARNYGALPSMYELYLSGGFRTADVAQAQDFTGGQTIDTGGGGGGAQIPGAIDTLVAPPTADEMTFQDLVDSDANRGFVDAPVDTTMPPMLTPGMGADSFIDTTPPDPGAGRISTKGTPISEMGTRPPDFVAGAQTFTDPEPSGGRLALGRADITPEIQTPPGGGDPDMFYDEPVNLVEQDFSGRPIAEMRGDITPAIETRPPEFVTGIQPEEDVTRLEEMARRTAADRLGTEPTPDYSDVSCSVTTPNTLF